MIDRRAFIALSAAVAFAGAFPKLDLPDLRVDALELEEGEGVEILGISPDASTLIGRKNRDQLCFYSAETRFLITMSDPVPEIGIIDLTSIRWNPDCSRVAFSLDSFRIMRDSDIFVVDVATGEVTNVTGEGTSDEAPSLLDIDGALVDMHPQWLDDETVLFVRHDWDFDKDITASLMSLRLGDPEATIWAELTNPDLRFVLSPTKLLADGRMVFAADAADNRIRLFSVTEGETPQMFDTGDIVHFRLIDANETHCLLQDSERFAEWQVSYDDPDATVDVREFFEMPIGEGTASLPALGPSPNSLIIARANRNRSVLVYEDDQVREIAYLRGPDSMITQIVWLEGLVLVAGRAASWLIPLED